MYYSQCGEDKILYEKFFKNYQQEGKKYYLEMGAIDGLMYSNTKFYEDTLGWTGILVEPDPFQFSRLIVNRPNNLLINALCSDKKSPLEFSICKNIPAVNSVKMTQPSDFDYIYYNQSPMIRTHYIPVSLDTIIDNSGLDRIDLCIIDVEGHEINVINSYSFNIPIISWLIEFLEDENKNNDVIGIMEKNNYKYIEKCKHNGFFIHNNYLSLFNL